MDFFYQKHVFICNHRRSNGRKSCGHNIDNQTIKELSYKFLSENKEDKVRVSVSGCLGRCDEGPCLVIYPKGQWKKIKFNSRSELIIEDTK